MTTKSTKFAISEVTTSEDFKHPLLKFVRFVFADDKPNGNNQGIAYEDFEEVKKSAIDMPIKMRFLGEAGAGGHTGSVTIGHIKGIEEEEDENGHRLIASGVLYAGEYPDEVKYLEEAFAEGNAPGASWEVVYTDVKKEGIVSWLKGIITSAATFVRNPAYGTRTALLALASNDLSDEELSEKLLRIVDEIRPKNGNEGGSNKVEEELQKVKAELAEKIKEIEKLISENESLTTVKTELETAKAELEGQLTETKEVVATYQRKELIADRVSKMAEAGLKVEVEPEKVDKAFWVSLSEEAFEEYLETIKSVKPVEKVKIGLASLLERSEIPRVSPSNSAEPVTIEDLKQNFRARNRGLGTTE